MKRTQIPDPAVFAMIFTMEVEDPEQPDRIPG